MKILIIGPSWVGDMVMSQSLYITLKQQHPDAIIDVMAPAWCKPILERMPEVNQAIEMPLGHGDFDLFGRRRLGKQLKTNNYTHAYICPNSAKSALIPWFADIPKRIGWKGEMRYGLLNDLRPNKKSFQYMVERYVALAHPKSEMIDSSSLGGLDTLPRPKLTIDTDVQQTTLTKFSLSTDKPVLGLCPGAEFGPAKQWPVEHYAAVANEMINQGHQVWLFGSAKDKETTEAIKSLVDSDNQNSVFNLAGDTSLIEAVDLLAACKTVVSNDSGLMHVAAAVGCHVVGVYGSTSPKYTPPLAEKVDIVSTDIKCRPCFKRECEFKHLKCLTELNPQLVLDKISPKNISNESVIQVTSC
ncbi:lipopolysaccharide heptosyltransferase II [Aliivibrio finisterrensis]|uniref:lipopolysaccharide heptosyltransferase II n=1 Tax=Aliivibrio finisterrensis TaxID=511998 RepID=UPI00101EF5C4|nr:lipopolysaccharide heptosyltransferase II [Aliivibrio finisterrensis]RYU67835.1 lipopolysaccharide heptosyltransferase II [Aliivibrio finisterrensis]RYU71494.1 lipopolysaccharide heptosyltransferase II [Aliivibrio finisterrensis]RYU74656.1 lipopolysaccharide heptosyltransferase II [Aliivibrio finisterrensis]